MTSTWKQDIVRNWPTLLGLFGQTIVFAFFLGVVYATIINLKEDVTELKKGFASNDRVGALEGRVDRIDGRVLILEQERRQ